MSEIVPHLSEAHREPYTPWATNSRTEMVVWGIWDLVLMSANYSAETWKAATYFYSSSPKDKNKSYLKGKTDKTWGNQWSWRGDAAIQNWMDGASGAKGECGSYRILYFIGWLRRKVRGWGLYFTFSIYVSVPGLRSVHVRRWRRKFMHWFSANQKSLGKASNDSIFWNRLDLFFCH